MQYFGGFLDNDGHAGLAVLEDVLFITHAGEKIGGGHLSRCIALSQAFEQKGFSCSWLLNKESKTQAIKNNLHKVYYLDDPFHASSLSLCESIAGNYFTVIDSYSADISLFSRMSKKSKVIAIADDIVSPPEKYLAALINYSFGAKSIMYDFVPTCSYFIGPSYALLRKDFWDVHTSNQGYVLFAPGASDVANTAEKIVGCWQAAWPWLIIALGGFVDFDRISKIKEIIVPQNNVSLAVDSSDFVGLMSSAAMIICTSSVTAYEALSMKKKIAVFSVVENQSSNGEYLEKINAAYNFGCWDTEKMSLLLPVFLKRSFDEKILSNFVNPRGALLCVEEITNKFNRECSYENRLCHK